MTPLAYSSVHLYETPQNLEGCLLLCERRSPRPSARSKNWYRQRAQEAEEHPVTLEVQARLERRSGYRVLWSRILDLSGKLGERLEGDLLNTWLELEEALHKYGAWVAEEHYNVGVDDGRTIQNLTRLLKEEIGEDELPCLKQQLHLLAEILYRLAER